MAALRSRSSSFTYDVFLSFRGKDTRYGFTGHLYKALCDKGIQTFFDNEELQSGEEITPALVMAIQESRIAITVLSINYAYSSFCLDKLATIIDCKSKGLLVIPVFYKVDPSDVRHHKGSYGEALAKHGERFKHNMDKLQKWKMALSQVADFSGHHIKDRDEYEYKFIGSIVDCISNKINPAHLHVGDYLVGLESRVAQVMKLLDVGSAHDGVHIIGIHGMGGVGKSTLARAVYNDLIAHNFHGLCFLENVREKSNKHGLEHLQSFLLQEILRDKNINITSWKQGALMITQRLKGKKVLLVLDDVDEHKQLQAIFGSSYWFGPRSRVIITTRDKQLLEYLQVERTYEVNELNKNDALQLLTWNAFKKEKADPSYAEVLNRVLVYASGLPLALEVIGSNLFGKSVEKWKSAISGYDRIPDAQILKILKVSFDSLEEEEKSVFLDITCCFKGYKLTDVEDILRALYNDCMKYHLEVLVEKSLIKINVHGIIYMHDLILDMGRQLGKESPKKIEKRRRLWLAKDIIEVLKHNTGTSKIEIIYLDVPISHRHETIEWDGNAFKEMKGLKVLIIKNGKFSEDPKCLPNSLRVLEWWEYPSHCLPYDFQPKNLGICKLPDGCFTSFELYSLLKASLKKFENLTVLKFDMCRSLTQIPDVSGLTNLEKLSFEWCDNLVTVHKSIGFLAKLKKLSAFRCRKLMRFPPIMLTSLKELELSHCSRLQSFPVILGKMENIRKLHLHGTPIKELSVSFQYLIELQNLSLHDCGIVQLPSSIVMMPKLTQITASGWKGWKWLKAEENREKVNSLVSSKVYDLYVPRCSLNDDFFSIGFERFAHVEHLDLSENNFTFLPECIKEFQSLRGLNVSNCQNLQEIRGVPPNLERFREKNCESLISWSTSMFINQELYEAAMKLCCLPGAWVPAWFDHLSRGPSTSFWFRNKFPDNILCLVIAPVEEENPVCGLPPTPMVFINGKVHEAPFHSDKKTVRMKRDHTYLFKLPLKYYQFKVPLENEWNHVEVTYGGVIKPSIITAIGIHVFKQESSNEDIRFVDPYSKRKLDDDLKLFLFITLF